jgi:ferrous iron transport protein B
MAARTLESRRDRLTTMLITPLMSCSARLPIYILIIGAFFPAAWSANMLFLMYVIGIALAMVAARFLRSTIFRGETTPLVMELPPYRAPTLKGLMLHSWERSWMYVRKAGTIILIASIIMWAATSFPAKKNFSKDYDSLISAAQREGDAGRAAEFANEKRAERMAYTVAGRVGNSIEPLIRPMGFDWRIGTALIGAFSAKEIFVSQMGIVYSLGETDERSEALRARLQADYAPLVGFCIMLFCLIGLPCMATVIVTWRESGSWRFALTQLVGLTVLAYVVTVAVFQVGSALGIGV